MTAYRSWLLSLSLGPLLFSLGCGRPQTVERRYEHYVEEGRRVPPEGYGYYAQGLFLEHNGHMEAARTAYRRARSADPKSGAVWAGLARTYCRTDRKEAEKLFDRGLDRAQERYPLHLARSQCALFWKAPELALKDARAALRLGPDRAEASEAVARAAEALGDRSTADATRRGFRLFSGLPPTTQRPPDGKEAVDLALIRGDLDWAQSLAAGVVTPGELAVRAVALGSRQLAQSQVELVLAASPSDPDALTANAVLQPRAVTWAPPASSALSPLAACLFAGHLAAWAGTQPAALFLRRLPPEAGPTPPVEEWRRSSDQLLCECADHLGDLLP